MWTDIERNIRTILDTVSFLNPISVRMILNRNTGRSEPEDLRLYSIGRSNNAIESVDRSLLFSSQPCFRICPLAMGLRYFSL